MKKIIIFCLLCLGCMAMPKIQAQSMSHTECHDPRCKGLLTTWYINPNSSTTQVIQASFQRETVLGVSPGGVKWRLENDILTLWIDPEHLDLLTHHDPICIQIAVTDGYYHVEIREKRN